MFEFLWNPQRRSEQVRASSRHPLSLHRRLPTYRPTPLVRLHAVENELGPERVWIKDESNRLGLPAFKVLGVSWAVYTSLAELLGSEPTWDTWEDLKTLIAPVRPLCLAAATTGNHGRAVARVASQLDLEAQIYIPRRAPTDRVTAIRREGARIELCSGDYDEAVKEAAAWVDAQPEGRAMLISDTALDTDDRIPSRISSGYSTLFWEIEDQLAVAGEPMPDTVFVQIGAGSLALAAAIHFRRAELTDQPQLIGVEAASAACFLASARAKTLRTVNGSPESRMFCLNAAVPSRNGIDLILAGFDAFIAVGDDALGPASRLLAESGIVAGPTGTAGLMALREGLAHLPDLNRRHVLLLNTEGAADASGYAETLLA